MWPIDEYAISRLMLRLADGGERAEHHRGDRDEHHDLLPLRAMPGKRRDRDAHEQRHRRDLRRGREERRHRRRRALVDVRRPHVERHRRDLEAEAREQEHQPEIARCRPRRGLGDAGERDVAGEAVDQRRAVEQHAGRQRAEHEILEARLGRARRCRGRCGDDVEREAHQLEAEIERDQVVGRDHHHHAGGRQQNEDRELELLAVLGRQVVERHQDRDGRADQHQYLHEAREPVDDEAAVEGRLPPRHARDENAATTSSTIAPTVDDLGARSPRIGADHQQHHGADGQHDLGQRRRERRKWNGVHRGGLIFASAAPRPSPAASAAGSCRPVRRPTRPTCRAPASDRSRRGCVSTTSGAKIAISRTLRSRMPARPASRARRRSPGGKARARSRPTGSRRWSRMSPPRY